MSVRNGAPLLLVDAVTTNAYAPLLETTTGAYEGSERSENYGSAAVAWCLKGCYVSETTGSFRETSEAHVAD